MADLFQTIGGFFPALKRQISNQAALRREQKSQSPVQQNPGGRSGGTAPEHHGVLQREDPVQRGQELFGGVHQRGGGGGHELPKIDSSAQQVVQVRMRQVTHERQFRELTLENGTIALKNEVRQRLIRL